MSTYWNGIVINDDLLLCSMGDIKSQWVNRNGWIAKYLVKNRRCKKNPFLFCENLLYFNKFVCEEISIVSAKWSSPKDIMNICALYNTSSFWKFTHTQNSKLKRYVSPCGIQCNLHFWNTLLGIEILCFPLKPTRSARYTHKMQIVWIVWFINNYITQYWSLLPIFHHFQVLSCCRVIWNVFLKHTVIFDRSVLLKSRRNWPLNWGGQSWNTGSNLLTL